ncbi:hypothetical protein Tco_0614918 [Tanacetum coccineum]
MGPTDGANEYAKRGTYQAPMVEMLRPLGSEEEPSTGPSTGPLTGPSRGLLQGLLRGLRGEGRGSSLNSTENSTYLGLRKKYRLNLKNVMPPRDK